MSVMRFGIKKEDNPDKDFRGYTIGTVKTENSNTKVHIEKVDKDITRVTFSNNEGSNTISVGHYGANLLNEDISELELLDLDGHVRVKTGPLKGDIFVLSTLSRLLWALKEKEPLYDNNKLRITSLEGGKIYKYQLGDITIIAETICPEGVKHDIGNGIDLNVYLEE